MIDSAKQSRRGGSGVRLLIAGLVLWLVSSGALLVAPPVSTGHGSAAASGDNQNELAASRTVGAAPGTAPAQDHVAPDPSAWAVPAVGGVPSAVPAQPVGGVPSAMAAQSAVAVPSASDQDPANAGPAQSPALAAEYAPAVTRGAGPRRFVVLGDSLTAWTFAPGCASPTTSGVWPSVLADEDPQLVLANNAGVPANTTGQMLARLQSDVLDYNPDVLFVLGGTNDVGTDIPGSVAVANIRQIVQTAKGHGITVVLLTIPPAAGDTRYRLAARRDINADLAILARQEGILLVDDFPALATSDDSLAGEYAASDGLHLSQSGEKVVADSVYRALHPASPPQHG